MKNNRTSDERVRASDRLFDERRRFLRKLAAAVAVISGGLLFPAFSASALTLDKLKRPRNINKDTSNKSDLPLDAYPSFRKKCHTETYNVYHDASGTVRTFTKTVCD
jgi:hypothetical protein